ncbi:APC membrane recruitment protein like protein [Tanacetum coccineum]
MGSLGTHFTSFMFLFPLGIRRLVSSFSIYIDNSPSYYRYKTWFFSNSPIFKNLDFFAYIVALPIASFSNFFLFLAFSGHPVYKFSFLQQSLVVLLFWVVLVFVGVKEFFDPIAMPEHFLFVFAGVAFLVEYFMNGKGVVGLAELEYSLLGGLTLVCAFACFYLSIRPSAFFADFLLSGGIVLKGTWVLQVGLSLYSDEFAFKGCGKAVIVRGEGSADVKCVLDEDRLRGVALMNLLFVGHSIVVLILCFVIMGLLNRNKARTGELPMTAQIESDHMLMRPLPALEME